MCGTLLAALDAHPRVAMQILRHRRISVTMEIYTEATTAATRDARRRRGDELSPAATDEEEPGSAGPDDECRADDPERKRRGLT